MASPSLLWVYSRPASVIACYLPARRAATVVSTLPFTDQRNSSSVMFRERGRPEGGFPEVEIRSVSPEFFRTMGIDLRGGRLLGVEDRADAPRAVVINETMAQRWYPGADPIGQRLTFFVRDTTDWREIVGVVSDIRNAGLARDAKEEIYAAFAQQAVPAASIVVRATGDPVALASAVRGAMRAVDATQPIFELRTMTSVIDQTITRERFSMLVLAIFAAVALLLTRVLGRLLYGVTATDPVTFGVVTVLLGAIALAATYIPARRAATVDPMQALRSDG